MINQEIFESQFTTFKRIINVLSGEEFVSFRTSRFLDDPKKGENYKYSVYKDARNNLNFSNWKQEDVGSGKILDKVTSAMQLKVIHDQVEVDNNLINNWRIKDTFSKIKHNEALEQTLFDHFKSKVSDEVSFERLLNEKQPYNLIAYLFFLKEKNRFLPISQRRFDRIFELFGIEDFKTDGNASWENYNRYCNIIKEVRNFLKTKDKQAELLDAHSFLWILGRELFENSPQNNLNDSESHNTNLFQEEIKPEIEYVPSNATEITELQWIEILQNKNLTYDIDLAIFQAIYSFTEHKAYASQVGLILGTSHSPLNLEIGRYAKRISEHYDINFTVRSTEKYKFWDLFFNGWKEGTKFVWQLKPELIKALEATGLTGEVQYAEEIPDTYENLFEGLRKTIIVNSYERNSKARMLCVKHFKAICAVCSFDFEKFYGEIGKGFIHVHHIIPVSQIGTEYQINPINDLIPVCPNCHAMLHKQEPPISIEELKAMLTT